MEDKLYKAAADLPETELAFSDLKIPAPKKSVFLRPIPILVCFALLLCGGFGTLAFVAEAKEYKEALVFFDTHGLSAEGLTRGELKAVYRDITTQTFRYSKTAQVIGSSLSAETVDGCEILQETPTPEAVEDWWNRWQKANMAGIHYKDRTEYKKDPTLGFEVLDRSYLEKYDGETLLWSVSFAEFWIDSYRSVSDGVILWGRTYTWSSDQTGYAWLAKIKNDGSLQWKKRLENGFEDEYIAAVVENEDGSYAVFSRGDLKYFCFSRYSPGGKELSFRKTEVGNRGIWNAARLGDGYIVQLGNGLLGETSRIVKVDSDGTLTDSFSYTADDAYYFLSDMIEYNGSVYLSAYAVPRLPDEKKNAGGRYEIAAVLNYIFDHYSFDISSEELTPMVRKNYTALLLVCDPTSGTPREFYSVEGSLGGKLAVSEEEQLLWDVESIAETFFSPATSAFTIGGSCEVFHYCFSSDGSLLTQEKTGEVTPYYK